MNVWSQCLKALNHFLICTGEEKRKRKKISFNETIPQDENILKGCRHYCNSGLSQTIHQMLHNLSFPLLSKIPYSVWHSKHFSKMLSHFPQTSLSGSLNWLLFQRGLKDASVLSFVNSKWTCIYVSDQINGLSFTFYFLITVVALWNPNIQFSFSFFHSLQEFALIFWLVYLTEPLASDFTRQKYTNIDTVFLNRRQMENSKKAPWQWIK